MKYCLKCKKKKEKNTENVVQKCEKLKIVEQCC